MKKKNMAILCTAALLSLAVAGTVGVLGASASQTISSTDSGEKTVELKYTVESKWTVEIPDTEIDVSSGSATGTVTAKDLVLESDQKLSVTVESENTWKLVEEVGGTASIDYDIQIDGASIKSSGAVLTEVDGNTAAAQLTKTLNITLTNPENAKVAGTYSDTLTFKVTVS